MPVEGQRSVAICRQCQCAFAVRILADGSVRPIGTGSRCSCGGESFEVAEDLEDTEGDGDVNDGPADDDEVVDGERRYPKP